MKRLVCLCILLLGVTSVTADIPQDLIGNWFGVVLESSYMGKREFPIALKIERMAPHMTSGGVAYQTLQCNAVLTYLYHANGWYYFAEQIHEGRKKCASGNARVKFVEPNRIAWERFYQFSNQPVTKGTLERELEEVQAPQPNTQNEKEKE
jgi:hypothetical protein